jgi:hypothetical protein
MKKIEKSYTKWIRANFFLKYGTSNHHFPVWLADRLIYYTTKSIISFVRNQNLQMDSFSFSNVAHCQIIEKNTYTVNIINAGTRRLVMEILRRMKSLKQCDVTVEICISQSIQFRPYICFWVIFHKPCSYYDLQNEKRMYWSESNQMKRTPMTP